MMTPETEPAILPATPPAPDAPNLAPARRRAPFDRRIIPDEVRESAWIAPDGHAIRRIDWGASPVQAPTPPTQSIPQRGSLLFLPGRGDAYEKYLETLAGWHDEGWQTTALDWRWQAGSGRAGLTPATGHIDDFARWVDDLAAFWREWQAATPAPHVLVGHSMGGHLVLRALAERRVDPAATILVSPMLGLHGLGLPTSVLHAVARTMARIAGPRRPAWRESEKPGSSIRQRMELLTHDADRYADEEHWRAKRPELAMGAASWGWLAAALASIRRLEGPGVLETITTPVLVLGTRFDGLVRWRAIARAAGRLRHGELLAFGREAAHELLRETDPVRTRALAAIDDFLDRVAPRRQPAA